MIIDLHSSSPQLGPDSKVYFDANVWIYLFAPTHQPDDEMATLYSRLLSKIKKSSADIIIDSTVISEYVNTCLRIECRAKAKSLEFDYCGLKKFRESHQQWYNEITSEVANHLREILDLPNVVVVDVPFSTMNLRDMVDAFETDRRDWNDQIIAELCRTNSYVLVTHDADFKVERDLKILTYNSVLSGRVSFS